MHMLLAQLPFTLAGESTNHSTVGPFRSVHHRASLYQSHAIILEQELQSFTSHVRKYMYLSIRLF